MKTALFCALAIIAAFVGPTFAEGDFTKDNFDEGNSTILDYPDFLVILAKYGKMDLKNITLADLTVSLTEFQIDHKLPQTGLFDDQTRLQMIEEKRRLKKTYEENGIPPPEYVLRNFTKDNSDEGNSTIFDYPDFLVILAKYGKMDLKNITLADLTVSLTEFQIDHKLPQTGLFDDQTRLQMIEEKRRLKKTYEENGIPPPEYVLRNFTKDNSDEGNSTIFDYPDFLVILAKYGKMDLKNITLADLTVSLTEFQIDHKLPLTGLFDDQTRLQMIEEKRRLKKTYEENGIPPPEYVLRNFTKDNSDEGNSTIFDYPDFLVILAKYGKMDLKNITLADLTVSLTEFQIDHKLPQTGLFDDQTRLQMIEEKRRLKKTYEENGIPPPEYVLRNFTKDNSDEGNSTIFDYPDFLVILAKYGKMDLKNITLADLTVSLTEFQIDHKLPQTGLFDDQTRLQMIEEKRRLKKTYEENGIPPPEYVLRNFTKDNSDEGNSTIFDYPDFLVILAKYGKMDLKNITLADLTVSLTEFQIDHKLPQTGLFDDQTRLQMIEEKRRLKKTYEENGIPPPEYVLRNFTKDNSDEGNSTIFDYPDFLVILAKYGKMDLKNITLADLTVSLTEFQIDHKLPLTGLFDDQTRLQMIEEKRRLKKTYEENGIPPPEYSLNGRLPKTDLTYQLERFSTNTDLTVKQQRDAIKRAFDAYSAVTPLNFKETTQNPDIMIGFIKEKIHYHNKIPFNNDFAAHVFGGKILHFSDMYHWNLDASNQGRAFNLYFAALHEIGHIIGLKNSQNSNTVMFAGPNRKLIDLHPDDIAAAQALYGKRSDQTTLPTVTTQKRTTPKTITPPRPEGGRFCSKDYRKINAAMRTALNVFVFVDDIFVIDDQYRQKMVIRERFPDGPTSVQAAVYSSQANKAYLFHDKSVWAYNLDRDGRFRLVDGFPKVLPNTQSHNLEYAMKLTYNDREILLIVKNGQFQYFIPGSETMKNNRVSKMSNSFRSVPANVDATISSDEEIFFISGKRAFRMPKKSRTVGVSHPADVALRLCQYTK